MNVHTRPGLLLRALVFLVAISALAGAGLAQITTTGIRGIVRDPGGAVIPNATVKVTDNATGIERATVSASDGGFLFPNLQFGSYKLTVGAAGFQNFVIASVVVESGRTTNVSVDLKVGATTETIQVEASAAQLNTTTAEVGVTINNKLVQNLPYATRESLNFAVLMAGNAQTTSERNSTFNGLPNASLNITLDGMNNNSQRFKSGGTSFFAYAPTRIDSVEEVSVSTTGLGADAGGQGAMQIRLTTRRGTDQYHGKVVYQMRNEALNANSFFNNLAGRPRNKVRENDAAGSVGGPLLPFINRLKNKLFFFAYYEAVPQPGSTTGSTAVFSPAAQQGIFTYFDTSGVKRSVNLLQVAGAAGFTSTVDPTIARMLSDINATRANADGFLPVSSAVPTEFQETMQWTQATSNNNYYPTVRLDYQITPKVAWHGTWNLQHRKLAGAPPYPGNPYDFPNSYKITTYVATNAVDWAIKPNMINSASFGIQSKCMARYGGPSLRIAPTTFHKGQAAFYGDSEALRRARKHRISNEHYNGTMKIQFNFVTLSLLLLAGCSSPSATDSLTQQRVDGVIAKWLTLWSSYDTGKLDEIFWRDPGMTYFSSEKRGLIKGIELNAAIRAQSPLTRAPGARVTTISPVGLGNEPSIAVNPKNPNQVIAAYQGYVTVAYSTDSGRNFTVAEGLASPDWRVSGDPSVTFDNKGQAFLCFLAFDQLGTTSYWGHGAGRNGIFVRRSPDGGKTWEKDAVAVKAFLTGREPNIQFEDMPRIFADNAPKSPHAGNLYVGWIEWQITQSVMLFSRSTDEGKTWSPAIRISTQAGFPRDDPANRKTRVTLARSTDGGQTFTNYAWNEAPFEGPQVNLGDYTWLTAYNNRVYGIWVEAAPLAPNQLPRPASATIVCVGFADFSGVR